MRNRLFASLLTFGLVAGYSPMVHAEAPKEVKKAEVKPWLGIAVEGTGKDAPHAGAVVREVAAKSPADQAGVKTGDVVVKVGGKDVKNADMLVEMVATHKPGDKLKLHVWRDGKEHDLAVTLGERASTKVEVPTATSGAFLGVWSQALSPELKDKLGVTVDKGAVVMQVMPESPAAKAGLMANDVITMVDDRAIATPMDLREAVQRAGHGKEITIKAVRGKEAKEFKVKLDENAFGFGRLPEMKAFQFQIPEGANPELKQKLEEMQKHFRELEEKFAAPSK